MLNEILIAIITICFVGGLFYVIRVQMDLISARSQHQMVSKETPIILKESPVVTCESLDGSNPHSQIKTKSAGVPQRKTYVTDLDDVQQDENISFMSLFADNTYQKAPWEDIQRTESNKQSRIVNNDEKPNHEKKPRIPIISALWEKIIPPKTTTEIDIKSQVSNTKMLEEKYIRGLIKRSTLHENIGTLKVYKLELRQVSTEPKSRLRKLEFGKSSLNSLVKKDKVIMIVGATGSGKTTLINSMINYVFGVEYEDKYRFKLVTDDGDGKGNQAYSQTSWITAYTIHHQKGFRVEHTLTIIDTPGFGDTRGIQRDVEITKQIHNFFTIPGNKGIDHIDAVGFVAQSSLPRLTFTQKYIFDQILSLFGKDIAENIYLMLTFADGKAPQVLNGIDEAHMPYQEFFKFNNSVIFDDNTSEDEFAAMFWKMGMRSFEKFFHHFSRIQSKSLTQTKSVLEERDRIETQIEGLQKEVKHGLNKLEKLRKEVEVVEQHQSDLARNKDFTYTVEEDAIVKNDIEPNKYVTNCLTCNYTCHYPCGIPDDGDKYRCSAMNDGGIDNAKCNMCTKRCFWQQHKNMKYYFTIERNKVTKTSEDLKNRYLDATGKVKSANDIVEAMVNEFEAVQIKIIGITEVLRKSINKLNKIALKPTSISTSQYIHILIESEKSAAEPGWTDRVDHLTHVKEKADSLEAVAKQGFDPFLEYKRKIQEERETKQGVWCAVANYLQKIQYWSAV